MSTSEQQPLSSPAVDADVADESTAISHRLGTAAISLVGPHHLHLQCNACGSIWSPVLTVEALLEDGWWRCPRGCNSPLKADSVKPLEVRKDRWRLIGQARDEGNTLEQIGEAFGITRQRVCAILKQGEPRANGRPRKRVSA